MIIYLDWSIDLADDHRANTGLIWGGNLLLIRFLKGRQRIGSVCHE